MGLLGERDRLEGGLVLLDRLADQLYSPRFLKFSRTLGFSCRLCRWSLLSFLYVGCSRLGGRADLCAAWLLP